MRERIYRNLDRKVEIFGLSILQLGTLCVLSVALSEAVRFFDLGRGWTPFFIILGIILFRWINHRFGFSAVQRAIRFAQFPEKLVGHSAHYSRQKKRFQ